MSEVPVFDPCDPKHTFAEVEEKLSTSETRTLWNRIYHEVQSKGTKAVGTYLDSEFTQFYQDFLGAWNAKLRQQVRSCAWRIRHELGGPARK